MNRLPQFNGDANHARQQTLELAEIYARAGVRVLPITYKSKAACLHDWPNNATTDHTQITKWFGNGTARNLGMAMGVWAHTATDNTYLVCVDIDTANGKNGLQNWQQLVADNGGNIGEPFTQSTPTGGLHLVYAVPVELTNETGALPEHIDVRGQGGYIMTEPSAHPDTENKYGWRAGSSWPTSKPGLMPQWLLDIIQYKPEPIQRTATPDTRLHAVGDTPRPGDIYNQANTWDTELAKHGWQFVETKSDNHGRKDFYARPGKPATKDAHSAVLARDEGEHGVFVVFSTGAPKQLQRTDHKTDTGGHYKFNSPFDFYACMHHEGDHKQAARVYGAELRPQQQHETDQLMGTNKPQLSVVSSKLITPAPDEISRDTWVTRTMDELIGVPYEPRVADRLIMNNGRGLFYSNADNMTSSGSGQLKTWLSAITCLQQIQLGKHVMVIDFEMHMHDWFKRFELLGATPTELKLIHYCAPDEALHDKYMGAERATKAQQQMHAEIARVGELPNGLAWVVLDGITNAMTLENLKLIDNTDTATFWRLLPRKIWQLTGAGVGSNDHIAKGTNDNPTPLGSQHKTANTSGASHILKATSYLSSHPKTPGVVVFNCIKDRHGEIGQGRKVAQATITPLDNGQMHYVIEPYTGEHMAAENTRHNRIINAVKDMNKTGVQASQNKILQIVGGSKSTLPLELETLQAKGILRNIGTAVNQNWQVISQDIDSELF